MKGVNINTAKFVRWLESDPVIWDELTPLLENRAEVPEHRLDEIYDEVREMLEQTYRTEATEVFDLEELCEVDLDQVMALITDGYVCVDVGHSKTVSLSEVLYPKCSAQPESNAYGILSGKRINGKSTVTPSEDWGGNVGAVVEPNPGAEEVRSVLSECKDVREVAR